jgi:hypothetical protein
MVTYPHWQDPDRAPEPGEAGHPTGGTGPTLDALRDREMEAEGPGPSLIEGPESPEWTTLKAVRLAIAELPILKQVQIGARAQEIRLLATDDAGVLALALVGAEKAAGA